MNNSPEYIYSELPAIQLFQKLGYQYLDAAKEDPREDIATIFLKDRLLTAIKKINPWISDNNLDKAFNKITSVQGASLMEINQGIWQLLRGGSYSVKQVFGEETSFPPVSFIDYKNIENNDFLVVNQMRFKGKGMNSVPDLVVFVNGMPLAVIECKSPNVPQGQAESKALGDLAYYQENSEKLFHYNAICAGIWQVGGKYGAIHAPTNFYSHYKIKQEAADELDIFLGKKHQQQDILIYHLFEKKRFLDILRHFVIFELDEGRTIKKLPRYQQYRATNRTIEKLQAGQGGVVWHTQGSGKSITMAYVTRKLQAQEFGFENPTIIIMTDRKDLDNQISNTFNNVGFKNVSRASSVIHLEGLLSNDYGGIITTTLQKFQDPDKKKTDNQDQTAQEEDDKLKVEKTLQGKSLTKITKRLVRNKWVEVSRETIELEELSEKKNLYVLVDEAHRSQYGFLASFMRTVMPHAKFVAFTGTPISNDDKSTLGEFYGGKYIDVYTIKESVADGATVELLYDEGVATINVKKEALDAAFDLKFGQESVAKRDKLKREALRKYQMSKSRMQEVAKHIVQHFGSKIFPDGHKGMIVCQGREAALRYKEALEDLKNKGFHDFKSNVIISVGSPKEDHLAKEYHELIEWNKNNPKNKKPVYLLSQEKMNQAILDFKLPFGDESETELSGKKKFDNTALLIVSDMLLTGYDVPIASCLYLDKPLKEHNLLQAIARVNRSGKRKNAGFIVDYNGITENLIEALKIFSGDIRPNDILKNINEEIPRLKMHHTALLGFFKPIKINRTIEKAKFIDEAIRYLEPVNLRDDFKDLLKKFNKSVNIVLPNTAAMLFEGDFRLFNELKLRAKNAYPDDEDLKISKDESKMLQAMIDKHLESLEVKNLLKEPVSIIDKEKFEEEIRDASPATKELKMRNNLKHTIKTGLDKNPDYYKPLAQRLEELLQMKEEKRMDGVQMLLEFTKLQDQIINENKEGLSKGFKTKGEIAIFNSMKTIFDQDGAKESKELFAQIKDDLEIVEWWKKGRVAKSIENKITNILKEKLDRSAARQKARELIEVLKKNKDA